MRRVDWMVGVVALLAGGASAGVAACVFNTDTTDCGQYPHVGCAGYGSSTGSAASSSSGRPPTCPSDPTATTVTGKDLAGCGVFVSASASDASSADGTLAKPFPSLSAAASVSPSQVYVCADAPLTDTATAVFSQSVWIIGGYTNCGGKWEIPATPTPPTASTSTGPADLYAIEFDGATNQVTNLAVSAPSATKSGGSSIAVLASGGALAWSNGSITAGDAKAGNAGTTVADDPTLDGIAGTSGANTCDLGSHLGPAGPMKTCATGGSSTGGKGGDGGQLTMGPPLVVNAASNGTAGVANPVVGTSPSGNPGSGEGQGTPAMAMCSAGISGASGVAGSSGAGGTGIGVITTAGYQGGNGKPGGNGNPGQGGGGGGGAKGTAMGTCGSTTGAFTGASGGAGGTGGCGGNPGTAGTAGGSSIALLLIDATVTLGSDVTLTSGAGGAGGQGGSGQNGGGSGLGGALGNGASANNSCQGGPGGKGGSGGPAGGGQGGHSLGIAFQSATVAAPKDLTSTIQAGTPGAGGAGGTNSAANGGKGGSGMAAKCFDFGKSVACM